MTARLASPAKRRALTDALRDMMREGESPRRLLRAQLGLSPHALRQLRLSTRTPAAADRRPQ
jgi:hypothetical protein